jgi:hypothetical protein
MSHHEDLALVMLNGHNNLTQRQQQLFAHLILKALGACHRPDQHMFNWCTSGDLEQDCEELAQVLFKSVA